MRSPPPLATCLRVPITTGIIVLAIIATLRWWSGMDIQPYVLGPDGWWRTPWQFVTPALFHADVIHLAFNLYCFWLFGARIETELGSGRTLGIYLLLDVGSGAAEAAIFQGGVGLSGVVYGLFGFLWVVGRRDPRFRDVLDRQTVQILIAWFFLCIALTVANVWKIANVAHGSGFVMGVLLGWAMHARSLGRRLSSAAVLTITLFLALFGSTVARPWVNCSPYYAHELAYQGYMALERGEFQRAIVLYKRAVVADPTAGAWWFNLGVAYQRGGQAKEASVAYQRAHALDPENPKYRQAVLPLWFQLGGAVDGDQHLDADVPQRRQVVH
jgi:membrane associated rhomboid family serine protease